MDAISRIYIKELHNDNSNNSKAVELWNQYKAGNMDAREKLIKDFLLYVVQIANEYKGMGVQYGDLIQEGNIGLMTALEKFDPSRGTFASCAKWWIKQSIMRNAMLKKRIVRLPENVSNLMMTDRWSGLQYREISIDTPNEEGDTMADDIPDTDTRDIYAREEEMLLKKKAEHILSFVKGRDAEVVKACYGIGREKPLEIVEAAELFNVTPTRINQILRNSLKTMRLSHEALPQSNTKEVEIVSAKYGSESNSVDVTDKVVDLYLAKEQIKSCNRLGGDPCPGIKKSLVIEYILGDQLLSRSFSEGSFVKF